MLPRIEVPTLVLNARNDPFLPEPALMAATRKVAPCVLLELPRTGGHVGFRDVDHYWTAASSGPWLERIRVPTLVINARNDPFLPEQDLLAATRDPSPSLLLEFPHTGGHVGFLSGPFPGRHDWLPQHLLDFLLK